MLYSTEGFLNLRFKWQFIKETGWTMNLESVKLIVLLRVRIVSFDK